MQVGQLIMYYTPKKVLPFAFLSLTNLQKPGKQGWGAGAGARVGQSQVFLDPWSRSRLEKKSGARAGAAKK